MIKICRFLIYFQNVHALYILGSLPAWDVHIARSKDADCHLGRGIRSGDFHMLSYIHVSVNPDSILVQTEKVGLNVVSYFTHQPFNLISIQNSLLPTCHVISSKLMCYQMCLAVNSLIEVEVSSFGTRRKIRMKGRGNVLWLCSENLNLAILLSDRHWLCILLQSGT